jgi:pimeloyl-ACP methyl ester carboxylesterase
MPWLEKKVSINGCAIYIREIGAGEPLVYLHGAGGADTSWPMLQGLSDLRHVIVPDHPGFGRSDVPPWFASIHDLAYAYLDLFEALDLKRIHLVGMSLGGWLAVQIAVRSTQRIAALSLICPAGFRGGNTAIGDLFAWDPAQRVQQLVHDPALAARINALPRSPEQLEIAQRNWAATLKVGQPTQWADPQLEAWLHRIDVPLQLLWGAEDRLFPLPYARRLQGLLGRSLNRDAPLHVIENCGHMPQVENPTRLGELLARAPTR